MGWPELLIVLLVVLLLFGSTKLPKLAKSLGEASREFKKSVADPSSPAAADEKITMTRAEMDAALAEREAKTRQAQARTDVPPTP